MNWKQLRDQIRDLGFETDTSMDAYRDIAINACNRAIRTINSTVRPILGRYVIDHPGGFARYDLAELTKGEDYAFESLANTPVREADGQPFPYRVEERRVVLLDIEAGEYAFFYRKRPTAITTATPDYFDIELDFDVQPLLPLLASYYIWLDDDERKSVMYQNMYEDLKGQILGGSGELARAEIVGGFSWRS